MPVAAQSLGSIAISAIRRHIDPGRRDLSYMPWLCEGPDMVCRRCSQSLLNPILTHACVPAPARKNAAFRAFR